MMGDREDLKKEILKQIHTVRVRHEQELKPLYQTLFDLESTNPQPHQHLIIDEPIEDFLKRNKMNMVTLPEIKTASDRHCCPCCPAPYASCKGRRQVANGPIVKHLRTDECKEKHCLHTRIKNIDWPDGGAVELCLDCGLSRYIWEQGDSEWMLVDVEQGKSDLEKLFKRYEHGDQVS
jgi:hypothetical protein